MEEKVYALKPSFIMELHEEWKSDFSSLSNSEFIKHINQKYKGDKLLPHVLPGDNGLYIDDDVAFRINNLSKVGTEANWDLDASKLLFEGCGNGFGIFQKDENGKRIPLDMIYATDTRVWNYLSLFRLHSYTKNRWGESKDSKRLFINTLSNEKVTRHPIMRLYWTAQLCYDPLRNDSLELLPVLWKTNDFMTQVTERQQANMREHTQWFLDFCKDPKNSKILNEKSSDGYKKYRTLLKLYLAQDQIYVMANTNKKHFLSIIDDLLKAC
jgi:hypothetical protein